MHIPLAPDLAPGSRRRVSSRDGPALAKPMCAKCRPRLGSVWADEEVLRGAYRACRVCRTFLLIGRMFGLHPWRFGYQAGQAQAK
ncbi:hypothetical protein GGTG_11361 [Gaeumannomyces tritici R3-111a-1]|uniref:Uncharacterized protein n=1 Tax=Gaeumannomyces tritici (strain R3-111a-1) TaxID=644352 RepID=J3PCY8_GAET3|nr:hypothetical protein GGTG_11361 [Gaeumannomyces tritici R3-111a-1]EJT70333.1 hypothetical protein GGTG_11361 [Gaeumannomyces tritici R3-111a-1]